MLESSAFNGTTIVISPDLLINHIGRYRVELIPTNPAGDGPVFSEIVNLNKGKDSFHFIIHNVSLRIHSAAGDEFVAMVYVQVEKSCILRIPNNLNVFSTCSARHNKIRYSVDVRSISDSDGIFVLHHLLQPNKHNCSFFVADDVGNVHTFKSGKRTVADGCWITVVQDDKIIREDLFHINGSNSVLPLGPFRPGKYTLTIYDCINGSKSSVPVIQDHFIIPILSSVPSASSLPTIVRSTGGYDDDDTRRKHKKNNNTALILGITVGIVVLIKLIVTTILLLYCLRLKKTKKCFFHKNGGQHEDNTSRHFGETEENKLPLPVQESAVELRNASPIAVPCSAAMPTVDNQTTNSKADHKEPSVITQCHQTSAQVFVARTVSSSEIIYDLGQLKSQTTPDARPDVEYGYSYSPARGSVHSSQGSILVISTQQVLTDLKHDKECFSSKMVSSGVDFEDKPACFTSDSSTSKNTLLIEKETFPFMATQI